MTNRIATLSLVLLGVIASGTGFAQTATFQVRPSAIITDDFLVKRSCDRFRKDLLTAGSAELRDLLKTATDACKQVKRRKITHEQWFMRIAGIQSKAGSAYEVFIPRSVAPLPEGFKSYSILLMPSSAHWDDRQSSGMVRSFLTFGYAIGEHRAATLLLDQWEKPDLEWSKHYCDRLGLNYNDGPYVVTSAKRPDLLKKGDEFVVLRFSNIAPERAVKLLNELEQDLRTQSTLSKRALEYEEIKQRILTFVDAHSDDLLKLAVETIGSKRR